MRGARWCDDPAGIAAMQKKVPQSVGECFALIEDEYFVGPWVMGDRYGVSDMYLFTLASWLEADGVDPARFPKVAAHRERMRTDPAVRRVIAAETAPA
jgi:glutathione S-transferase